MVEFQLSPEARLMLLLALGLTYAARSIRIQPPGVTRLLMSMPLVLLFTVAPFTFEKSIIMSGSLGFLFGWLGNFKLIAFSADRGPLAYPGLGAVQWLLLLLLPYFPAKRGHTRARASRVVLSLLLKVAFAAALTAALMSPLTASHRLLRHTGYALYVWLWASLLLDAPMPLGCQLLGHIELQPAMNNPFASASLREFWGRRYNQIVSAILKDTVYEPIMDGSWMATRGSFDPQPSPPCEAAPAPDSRGEANGIATTTTVAHAPSGAADSGPRRRPAAAAARSSCAASQAAPAPPNGDVATAAGCDGGSASRVRCRRGRASERRRWVAMVAAFVVSGLMHEACVIYMCGFRLEGSFRMMGFFLLQPLLILAQDAAAAASARLVPERIRSSRAAAALSTVMTLALVLAAADELFWGPLVACRADERGLAEVMGAMRAAGEWYCGFVARMQAGLAGA